jgi:enoyl-CoA hydratase
MDYQAEHNSKGAIFRLNRPAKLNSLTKAIWAGLADCVTELERRNGRYLIIVGEGERAFCAGTDLGESKGLSVEQRDAKNDYAREFLFNLSKSKLITIAAINGLAYGGGLELAMACSFRIAVKSAKFALPEVKLGVMPTYGGTQSLVALVGTALAADLMLTGRSMGTDEALRVGLINRIAESDRDLMDQAVELSEVLSRYSPVAMGAIRRCIAAAGSSVSPQGLSIEGREARLVTRSEDAQEGIAAFLEKRAPIFKGR